MTPLEQIARKACEMDPDYPKWTLEIWLDVAQQINKAIEACGYVIVPSDWQDISTAPKDKGAKEKEPEKKSAADLLKEMEFERGFSQTLIGVVKQYAQAYADEVARPLVEALKYYSAQDVSNGFLAAKTLADFKAKHGRG